MNLTRQSNWVAFPHAPVAHLAGRCTACCSGPHDGIIGPSLLVQLQGEPQNRPSVMSYKFRLCGRQSVCRGRDFVEAPRHGGTGWLKPHAHNVYADSSLPRRRHRGSAPKKHKHSSQNEHHRLRELKRRRAREPGTLSMHTPAPVPNLVGRTPAPPWRSAVEGGRMTIAGRGLIPKDSKYRNPSAPPRPPHAVASPVLSRRSVKHDDTDSPGSRRLPQTSAFSPEPLPPPHPRLSARTSSCYVNQTPTDRGGEKFLPAYKRRSPEGSTPKGEGYGAPSRRLADLLNTAKTRLFSVCACLGPSCVMTSADGTRCTTCGAEAKQFRSECLGRRGRGQVNMTRINPVPEGDE